MTVNPRLECGRKSLEYDCALFRTGDHLVAQHDSMPNRSDGHFIIGEVTVIVIHGHSTTKYTAKRIQDGDLPLHMGVGHTVHTDSYPRLQWHPCNHSAAKSTKWTHYIRTWTLMLTTINVTYSIYPSAMMISCQKWCEVFTQTPRNISIMESQEEYGKFQPRVMEHKMAAFLVQAKNLQTNFCVTCPQPAPFKFISCSTLFR